MIGEGYENFQGVAVSEFAKWTVGEPCRKRFHSENQVSTLVAEEKYSC